MKPMTLADADPVQLVAIEAGCGEPVVLLHGSGSSNRLWRGLIEALYDRYHVIAPDLVGYGATARWPHARAIAVADHGALLAALLKSVGAPVHLVGHGFGGAVASRFALDHPERVRSLGLIEPVVPQVLADGHARDRRLLAEIRSLARGMRLADVRGAPERAVESFIDFWNGEGSWRRLDADLRAELTRRSRTIIADLDAVAGEAPGPAGLERSGAPTFVLTGARSRTISIRIAQVLARAMPNAYSWSVEGAGHMLPLTHAAAVNRLVAAHIERHRAPSTVVRLSPSPARDRAGAAVDSAA